MCEMWNLLVWVVLQQYSQQRCCEGFCVGGNGEGRVWSGIHVLLHIGKAVSPFHYDSILMDHAQNNARDTTTSQCGFYEGVDVLHRL